MVYVCRVCGKTSTQRRAIMQIQEMGPNWRDSAVRDGWLIESMGTSHEEGYEPRYICVACYDEKWGKKGESSRKKQSQESPLSPKKKAETG